MPQQFFEFWMKLGQDMSSFIVVVEAPAAQLNDMGEPTTENVVISQYLVQSANGLLACNLCLG